MSFLLVVKYNYLFIILFPLLLLYNVVKKEGASMFVRVIKNNKGKKNTCFCALVESYRDSSGVPKHRVLINFGQVDEESVPFLKAAFVNVNIKFTKSVSLTFTSSGCYDLHLQSWTSYPLFDMTFL